MQNQEAYEREFKRALNPILEAQEVEALTNLEAHAGASLKANEEKLFNDAEADRLMLAILFPVMLALVAEQGALALIFAGDDDTDFNLTAAIRNTIQQSVSKMASNFNDETISRLSNSLAEGIGQNESLSKLKKRVKSIYSDAKGYRLDRIARTETLKASNNATELAYMQTGYVKARKWYANPGHCPICGEMNGRTVSLGQSYLEVGQAIDYTDDKGNERSYQIDYDVVENPPVHPNCRCTIVPVV